MKLLTSIHHVMGRTEDVFKMSGLLELHLWDSVNTGTCLLGIVCQWEELRRFILCRVMLKVRVIGNLLTASEFKVFQHSCFN